MRISRTPRRLEGFSAPPLWRLGAVVLSLAAAIYIPLFASEPPRQVTERDQFSGAVPAAVISAPARPAAGKIVVNIGGNNPSIALLSD
ncbi:MAG: hypothetical protein NTZ14_09070 [Hyphomicrobiales bacterium]|nr:hypothetical protein [Hyphomicrobiales bacterium]